MKARQLVAASLLLLGAVGVWQRGTAQTARPIVYVISIDGVIDLGLAPFLTRTLREAREAGAAAVLLDINTFGGRVDAAVAMRDALVNAPLPTVAFINPRAISAGALIALATETIVMADGGTIGAATPVVSGGDQPRWRTKSQCPMCGRSLARPLSGGVDHRCLPRQWWTRTWRLPAWWTKASSSL